MALRMESGVHHETTHHRTPLPKRTSPPEAKSEHKAPSIVGTLPPASSRKKAARDENTKNKGGGAHSGGGAAMTNSAAKSGREGEKRAGVENPSKGGSGGGGSSGGVGGNRNSSSGVQGVSRKRVRVVDEKLGEFSVVLQPYLGDHNDICEICDDGGDLLCCDFCNLVYHVRCVSPKLAELPNEELWLCPACTAEVTARQLNKRRREDNSRAASPAPVAPERAIYHGVKAENDAFRAVVVHKNQTVDLGLFPTAEDAARAYDRKTGTVEVSPSKEVMGLFGDAAVCNFPGDDMVEVEGVGADGNTVKGVVRSFHQWRAETQWGNKKRHLGFFDRLDHASYAYNRAAVYLHGPDARLNPIKEGYTPPPPSGAPVRVPRNKVFALQLPPPLALKQSAAQAGVQSGAPDIVRRRRQMAGLYLSPLVGDAHQVSNLPPLPPPSRPRGAWAVSTRQRPEDEAMGGLTSTPTPDRSADGDEAVLGAERQSNSSLRREEAMQSTNDGDGREMCSTVGDERLEDEVISSRCREGACVTGMSQDEAAGTGAETRVDNVGVVDKCDAAEACGACGVSDETDVATLSPPSPPTGPTNDEVNNLERGNGSDANQDARDSLGPGCGMDDTKKTVNGCLEGMPCAEEGPMREETTSLTLSRICISKSPPAISMAKSESAGIAGSTVNSLSVRSIACGTLGADITTKTQGVRLPVSAISSSCSETCTDSSCSSSPSEERSVVEGGAETRLAQSTTPSDKVVFGVEEDFAACHEQPPTTDSSKVKADIGKDPCAPGVPTCSALERSPIEANASAPSMTAAGCTTSMTCTSASVFSPLDTSTLKDHDGLHSGSTPIRPAEMSLSSTSEFSSKGLAEESVSTSHERSVPPDSEVSPVFGQREEGDESLGDDNSARAADAVADKEVSVAGDGIVPDLSLDDVAELVWDPRSGQRPRGMYMGAKGCGKGGSRRATAEVSEDEAMWRRDSILLDRVAAAHSEKAMQVLQICRHDVHKAAVMLNMRHGIQVSSLGNMRETRNTRAVKQPPNAPKPGLLAWREPSGSAAAAAKGGKDSGGGGSACGTSGASGAGGNCGTTPCGSGSAVGSVAAPQSSLTSTASRQPQSQDKKVDMQGFTREETKLAGDAFTRHGRNLDAVKDALGWKKNRVVEYYYCVWKFSPAYQVWKATRHQAGLPGAWGAIGGSQYASPSVTAAGFLGGGLLNATSEGMRWRGSRLRTLKTPSSQ